MFYFVSMSGAKQLAVVDKDLLIQLLANNNKGTHIVPPPPPAPPIDPRLREIQNIENDMNKQLKSPSDGGEFLSPRARLDAYNQLLAVNQTHTNQFKKNILGSSGNPLKVETVEKPSELGVDETNPWVREMMAGVTRPQQDKVKALLRHMNSKPGTITWNDKGRLVIDGQPLPDSNIVDIVVSAVKGGKHKVPAEDYKSFSRALKRINTPHTLITNKDYLKELTGISHSLKRKSSRPQQRQRSSSPAGPSRGRSQSAKPPLGQSGSGHRRFRIPPFVKNWSTKLN